MDLVFQWGGSAGGAKTSAGVKHGVRIGHYTAKQGKALHERIKKRGGHLDNAPGGGKVKGKKPAKKQMAMPKRPGKTGRKPAKSQMKQPKKAGKVVSKVSRKFG
jgi:hypothetical protein